MIGLLFSLLIELAATPADDPAKPTSSLSVLSELGKTIEITELRTGYYKRISRGIKVEVGKDSHGNPIYRSTGVERQFIETSDIPLNIGDSFGLQFMVSEIESGDLVILDLVFELPSSVKRGLESSNLVKSAIRLDSKASSQLRRVLWTFRKENPQFHLPGKWRIRVYNKGNLLISKRFCVVR